MLFVEIVTIFVPKNDVYVKKRQQAYAALCLLFSLEGLIIYSNGTFFCRVMAGYRSRSFSFRMSMPSTAVVLM